MKILFAFFLLFFHAGQASEKWEWCGESGPLPKEALARVKPRELKERMVSCAVPRLPGTFDGQSTVILQVQVDAEGNVRCASVISGGQHPVMRRAALEAAKQWKFRPLMVNRKAKPYVGILALIVSWDIEKSSKQCPKEKRRA